MLRPQHSQLRGRDFSVYILDLNEFAKQQGYAECFVEDNVIVDPRNGAHTPTLAAGLLKVLPAG